MYTAKPTAPAHEQFTCTCYYYQQSCVLRIRMNTTDIITQNLATEVNLITLRLLQTNAQLSVRPDVRTENITIYLNECMEDQRYQVNVTTLDKCGQQSPLLMINCEPCGKPHY